MPTIESLDPDTPAFVRRGINLASAGLGARGLSASDQFFAPLERMLSDADPVFIAEKYDDNGKWMDGWETRRRRDGGHDHCVIKLATPGRILGFEIDTAHFTGNNAPAAAVEACLGGADPDERTRWSRILSPVPLGPDARHFFACASAGTWSHLRLHIFPDGGIARLRVHGRPDLAYRDTAGATDLACSLNGGRVLGFSDAHYGRWQRLLAPGRATDMGDGWETRRRREPGYDWIVVALGARGRIDRAVVDTAHFKGNYPDRCSIQAADLGDLDAWPEPVVINRSMFWPTMLSETPLGADRAHVFDDLVDPGPVTHVRLNIFPDGGVSRLRLFGVAD